MALKTQTPEQRPATLDEQRARIQAAQEAAACTVQDLTVATERLDLEVLHVALGRLTSEISALGTQRDEAEAAERVARERRELLDGKIRLLALEQRGVKARHRDLSGKLHPPAPATTTASAPGSRGRPRPSMSDCNIAAGEMTSRASWRLWHDASGGAHESPVWSDESGAEMERLWQDQWLEAHPEHAATGEVGDAAGRTFGGRPRRVG